MIIFSIIKVLKIFKEGALFMRRFNIFFVILFFTIFLLYSVAFCDNRYEYLGYNAYSTFILIQLVL